MRGISLPLPGNRTLDRAAYSVVPVPTTLAVLPREESVKLLSFDESKAARSLQPRSKNFYM